MAFLDVDVHYDPHRRLGKNSKAPRLSQDELERALCKMCGNIAAYVIFEVRHCYALLQLMLWYKFTVKVTRGYIFGIIRLV